MHDNELEALKKKRLKEIKKQQQIKQQIEQIEQIAKQFMAREALERYSNIKVAHPEIAIKAITLIANASQTNQLSNKLTDEQFKRLLQQLQPKKERFRVIK